MPSEGEPPGFSRDEAVRAWRQQLPTLLSGIEATIQRFNPFAVLAVGLVRYALKDPETYEESVNPSIAPLEHVALLYAKTSQPTTTIDAFDHDVVADLFDELDRLMIMWPFMYADFDSAGDDKAQAVRMSMMMHGTLVRMPSFAHQVAESLRQLFQPFESWLCANLGFGVDDAIAIVKALETRSERVAMRRLDELRSAYPQSKAPVLMLSSLRRSPRS